MKIVVNKMNYIIYIFFVFTIYTLVFQNLLQEYITPIQYFDEVLAFIFFPVFILFAKKNKIKKYDLILIISLDILFLIGLYSNYKFGYQPLSIALSDIILVYKFFLVYYLFSIINKNKLIEKYSNNIVKHLKIITIILFIFTILNYIFKMFPYEERYGIMSNRLFYAHPTYLAAICIFLLCSFILFNKKINDKYIYILMFIILTTLRMKAIGFLIVFAFICLFVTKTNKRITLTKIAIIAVICILAVYDQIEYYFFEQDDSARQVLFVTAFEIANDHFPLGAGFGTYASHFSAQSYSPIYSLYHIQNTYGISKNNTSFISDTFWPMIIGQFGYIGSICYAISLIIIIIKLQKNFKKEDKYTYIAKVTAFAYLIIASTSESAFVNPISIPLAIIIGL